ncbi:MAG: lipoyl(octanoyl) transferase LipB [Alphaproteobacteria bacterium]|nr:lipoyl(octanoyl) transferase LipB [Alphaproteobacteria bacterium]
MIEWLTSSEYVEYPYAIEAMESRVKAIHDNNADELIWLLEHTPIYTAGTSAKPEDLLESCRFPVYNSGRGGQYTYHGIGQRIAYTMLDLTKRGKNIRLYIENLEEWIIRTLGAFNINGERRKGRVGIWVAEQNGTENKIAAIGVRVRHGITYHGIAINVSPNLDHFKGIIPCGIQNHGVTSMKKLGISVSIKEFDEVLKKTFYEVFEKY